MSYTIADLDAEVQDWEFFRRSLITIGLETPLFTFGRAHIVSAGATSIVFEVHGFDGTVRSFVHVGRTGETAEIGAE